MFKAGDKCFYKETPKPRIANRFIDGEELLIIEQDENEIFFCMSLETNVKQYIHMENMKSIEDLKPLENNTLYSSL